MYAAICNQKLVLASKEAQFVFKKGKPVIEKQYFCPRCHKPMTLVCGQSQKAFFKHFTHYRGSGENEEHRLTKLMLQTAFHAVGLSAQTEYPLAEGQLRADILVGDKLVLEVQCARLDPEEFAHRHRLYQNQGICDVWIVGQRHFLKTYLTSEQFLFLRRNELWQWYLIETHLKSQKLFLKHHIVQEPLTKRIHYDTSTFALDEQGIIKLWIFQPKSVVKREVDFQSQYRYLCQQITTKTKFGQQVAQGLYELNWTIHDLPRPVFADWRMPGSLPTVLTILNQEKKRRMIKK